MAADEGWVLGWTQIIQIHLDPPFCGYSVVTKRRCPPQNYPKYDSYDEATRISLQLDLLVNDHIGKHSY